jgi:succinylarginine dihydrolase
MESRMALDELTKILGLGSVYPSKNNEEVTCKIF